MQNSEATLGTLVITPRGRQARIAHTWYDFASVKHAWVKDAASGFKSTFPVADLALADRQPLAGCKGFRAGSDAQPCLNCGADYQAHGSPRARRPRPTDDVRVTTSRYEAAVAQAHRVKARWALVALAGQVDPEGMNAADLLADVHACQRNVLALRDEMRASLIDAGAGYAGAGPLPGSDA